MKICFSYEYGLETLDMMTCKCNQIETTLGAAVGQHKSSTFISTHYYCINISYSCSEESARCTNSILFPSFKKSLMFFGIILCFCTQQFLLLLTGLLSHDGRRQKISGGRPDLLLCLLCCNTAARLRRSELFFSRGDETRLRDWKYSQGSRF